MNRKEKLSDLEQSARRNHLGQLRWSVAASIGLLLCLGGTLKNKGILAGGGFAGYGICGIVAIACRIGREEAKGEMEKRKKK